MATTASWHRPYQQRVHRPTPSSDPERTLPQLRVGIDWSTPTSTAQTGPAEPTPEQQLAEQLRFVRAGYDAAKAKQPLYRPAVLRRTDTAHLGSGVVSPSGAHPQSSSGTATPIPPTSAFPSSTPGSPSGGSHDATLDVPHRKGSFASSAAISYHSGPAVDDLSLLGQHDLSRRCGTEWVEDKLVGRMMDRADWTPDSFRNFCSADRCSKRFGIFDRKHHCRLCGEVFCASCSSSRIDLLPPARQRRAPASFFADQQQLPLSAPPAPVTASPASGTVGLASSVADLSIARPPTSASAATTTAAGELELTPCRVCNLCASSLALNIDPLATRARKPLLEGVTSVTSLTPPDSRASITPPHHHYPQRTTSPGSPGRLRTLSAKALNSSDPNVRDASSSGSSRYSGSTGSTATTSPSSSAAPTSTTSALRHPKQQQQSQAYYHPFPHGTDSAELFSSPVETNPVVGGGRPKAGKKGGEVIPEHVQFGQVWHHADADRRQLGTGGDGEGYSDSEGDPPEGMDDLGMIRARRHTDRAGRNKVKLVLAGGLGPAGRRIAIHADHDEEEEDGQAAFSYQWSTF